MGELSKPQAFILFSLGKCYGEANKRFEGKPLTVSMSKAAFIELARAAGMVQKKERALYKNLEALEKQKLIMYENKNLALTPKGHRVYENVLGDLEPYLAVSQLLTSQDVLRYTKKVRAVLAKV